MVSVRKVDFQSQSDRDAFVAMLDHYSQGPFGDDQPLAKEVRDVLAERFASASMTFAFFAILDDQVVGLATCQEGFSTFRAAPRINIHDLVVHSDRRGQGIGRALLQAVRDDATDRGAYSVSLEVRVDNDRARGLYSSFGFSGLEVPVADKSHLFGTLKLSE